MLSKRNFFKNGSVIGAGIIVAGGAGRMTSSADHLSDNKTIIPPEVIAQRICEWQSRSTGI